MQQKRCMISVSHVTLQRQGNGPGAQRGLCSAQSLTARIQVFHVAGMHNENDSNMLTRPCRKNSNMSSFLLSNLRPAHDDPLHPIPTCSNCQAQTSPNPSGRF